MHDSLSFRPLKPAVLAVRILGLRAKDTHLCFHAGAEIEVARSDLNPGVSTLVNVEAATDPNVPAGVC